MDGMAPNLRQPFFYNATQTIDLSLITFNGCSRNPNAGVVILEVRGGVYILQQPPFRKRKLCRTASPPC
jgi:hypothetical protein